MAMDTKESLTEHQRAYIANPIRRVKKKSMRIRTKAEILRQIEWAENEHERLGKNIPVYRRAICEGCGTLFDNMWSASMKVQKRCAMCT